MKKIRSLDNYQKGVLIFMTVMGLAFAVIYFMTISRVGYRYNDAILVPIEENGNTVYSGKIKGEGAQFIVSNDNTVELNYGVKTYGPYTVKEDVTAIPKDKEMERLISIIKSYKETNIAILLPHAPDKSYEIDNDKYKSSVKYYYNQLSQNFTCSYYTSDTKQDKITLGKIHISTFKSAKGLEFDSVIIPQIELVDDAFTKQLNEYYVALTRAKTNLILLSNKRVENISKFNKIDSSLYDKISYTEQKSLYEIDF